MIELQTVWGWQPALYLFLGGLGAGTFVVATLIHFITKSHRKPVVAAMWFAIVFLAVGLLLLLTELSAPFRALMMWQSFSHLSSSWMAIGAWLLFAAVICCLIAAVLYTEWIRTKLGIGDKAQKGVGNFFMAIGAILAFGVAVYTGILLMSAPGVPFWKTALLPALFTVSAMDTGVAFMAILIAGFEKDEHRLPKTLEICTLVLVVLETIALVCFLRYNLAGGNPLFETMEPGFGATAAASANAWLSGQLKGSFWVLFVGCGLVIPFAMALAQVAHEFKHHRSVAVIAAIFVLVGGCTLRFITLLAGSHVDIVVNAVTAYL